MTVIFMDYLQIQKILKIEEFSELSPMGLRRSNSVDCMANKNLKKLITNKHITYLLLSCLF